MPTQRERVNLAYHFSNRVTELAEHLYNTDTNEALEAWLEDQLSYAEDAMYEQLHAIALEKVAEMVKL